MDTQHRHFTQKNKTKKTPHTAVLISDVHSGKANSKAKSPVLFMDIQFHISVFHPLAADGSMSPPERTNISGPI